MPNSLTELIEQLSPERREWLQKRVIELLEKEKTSWEVEEESFCHKVFRYVNGIKEYQKHMDYFPNGFPLAKTTTYFFKKNAQKEADRLNKL